MSEGKWTSEGHHVPWDWEMNQWKLIRAQLQEHIDNSPDLPVKIEEMRAEIDLDGMTFQVWFIGGGCAVFEMLSMKKLIADSKQYLASLIPDASMALHRRIEAGYAIRKRGN